MTAPRIITHAGEKLSMNEWSRRLGGSHLVVMRRLRQGWSEADAVTTPVRAMPLSSESMAAIGRRLGGGNGLVRERLLLGWSLEDASTKPLVRKRFSCMNCGASCDSETCSKCRHALKPRPEPKVKRERMVYVGLYTYPDDIIDEPKQRVPSRRAIVDPVAHPGIAAVLARHRARAIVERERHAAMAIVGAKE